MDDIEAIVSEDIGVPSEIEEQSTVNAGCPDTEAEIINHLLFHKAIIREPQDRLVDVDTYVEILQELDQGMHVVLDNPVDRAVAIAFQLVIDERFDPWNMDLVEFTKLYLKKIRKESDVNFIIAGKLVLMAWSILKSQSDRLLIEADRVDEPEDFYFDGWDVCDSGEEQQGVNYGQMILDGQPPLTEAVRSNDVRAVTLMSLVEAFDEAREEIALQERINKFAKKEVKDPIIISDKLHQESLQEDISITWQRICNCDDQVIPITKLWNTEDVYDKVTVFVSTLFLAKMQKVKLTQRKFPYGEIIIKNIESEDLPPMITEKAVLSEIPEIIPEEIQAAEPEKEDIVVVSAEDLAVV
jgi:segregation and condensation protein A